MLILRKPGGELFEPRLFAFRRYDNGEQIHIGLCAHGREIRDIDPQEFAPDQIWWVIGVKVDSGYQRIRGHYEFMTR